MDGNIWDEYCNPQKEFKKVENKLIHFSTQTINRNNVLK